MVFTQPAQSVVSNRPPRVWRRARRPCITHRALLIAMVIDVARAARLLRRFCAKEPSSCAPECAAARRRPCSERAGDVMNFSGAPDADRSMPSLRSTDERLRATLHGVRRMAPRPGPRRWRNNALAPLRNVRARGRSGDGRLRRPAATAAQRLAFRRGQRWRASGGGSTPDAARNTIDRGTAKLLVELVGDARIRQWTRTCAGRAHGRRVA
jgi:hypothetical protein